MSRGKKLAVDLTLLIHARLTAANETTSEVSVVVILLVFL
jgi:hypothetical protein